jgi:drug/metabolite transporter (DMT)-like permease
MTELRRFGIAFFALFGIFGALTISRRGELGLVLWVIALSMLFFGLVRPKLLRPAYKVWMAFSAILGFITSHLILMLLYYFLFTPIGFTMKVLHKNTLQRPMDANSDSYWIKKENKPASRDHYERMF